MKETLVRRALVALSLILGLVAQAASPAAAAYANNPAARDGQRPRDGVSVWVPRQVDFKSGWDFPNDAGWMVFGFDWYQPDHIQDLEGSEQSLEFSAEVPCDWASPVWSDTDYYHRQGYARLLWDTNIPAAALPYEETTYGEPGMPGTVESCGSGGFELGAGVLNAAALTYGQHYYVRVGFATYNNSAPANVPVTLRAQTGTVYDNNNSLITYDNRDCSWNDTEISGWNGTGQTPFGNRLDAAWCVWPDFTHTVVRDTSGLLYTGTSAPQYFATDKLLNQGMEGGGGPPTSAWGYKGSAAQYCNIFGWPSFDGSCFVQFNKGGTGTGAVFQDIGMAGLPQQSSLTAEVAVQCPVTTACPMQLVLWGSGSGGPLEGRSISYTIPAHVDGQPSKWWICRLDYDHGFGSAFSYTHSSLRVEIFNDSPYHNLNVDYAFVGARTAVQTDNEAGGNLNPANEPSCSQSPA